MTLNELKSIVLKNERTYKLPMFIGIQDIKSTRSFFPIAIGVDCFYNLVVYSQIRNATVVPTSMTEFTKLPQTIQDDFLNGKYQLSPNESIVDIETNGASALTKKMVRNELEIAKNKNNMFLEVLGMTKSIGTRINIKENEIEPLNEGEIYLLDDSYNIKIGVKTNIVDCLGNYIYEVKDTKDKIYTSYKRAENQPGSKRFFSYLDKPKKEFFYNALCRFNQTAVDFIGCSNKRELMEELRIYNINADKHYVVDKTSFKISYSTRVFENELSYMQFTKLMFFKTAKEAVESLIDAKLIMQNKISDIINDKIGRKIITKEETKILMEEMKQYSELRKQIKKINELEIGKAYAPSATSRLIYSEPLINKKIVPKEIYAKYAILDDETVLVQEDMPLKRYELDEIKENLLKKYQITELELSRLLTIFENYDYINNFVPLYDLKPLSISSIFQETLFKQY